MHDDATNVLFGVVIGACGGAILTIAVMWASHGMPGALMKDAIDHGAAHWTIDPQTGERSFEWITNTNGDD